MVFNASIRPGSCRLLPKATRYTAGSGGLFVGKRLSQYHSQSCILHGPAKPAASAARPYHGVGFGGSRNTGASNTSAAARSGASCAAESGAPAGLEDGGMRAASGMKALAPGVQTRIAAVRTKNCG